MKQHSLSEINALRELGQDQTNPDAPEAESQGAEFWKIAKRAMPPVPATATHHR